MKGQEDIWAVLKEKLPFQNNAHDKAEREKIWSSIDVNNNGYLSLAQVDKGMRDVVRIPQLFDLKPVLMRAFQAGKKQLKAKSSHGDDYVSKAEFRYLLMYLRQYYQYWVAFDEIDKNDDRKISLNQFTKAQKTLERWGIKGDPHALFKEADRDGKGDILFIEFVQWSIRKHLDIDTDDDYL